MTVFPDKLKHADATSIHKKKGKSDKTSYRPVIVLPNFSKMYEKLISNQLYDYFDDIIFPGQCSFWKGHSTQHCLLVMLEKSKESVDKVNEFGALSTDLSKAFDCIDHNLLIAKLFRYVASPSSLNLIFDIMPSYRLDVFRKTSDCNENLCRTAIQLFPVTFQNFA